MLLSFCFLILQFISIIFPIISLYYNHALTVTAIIDKTASFVKRVGPSFEKKITDTEKNNPKFAFLMPDHEFHEYYLFKKGAWKEPTAKPKLTAQVVRFRKHFSVFFLFLCSCHSAINLDYRSLYKSSNARIISSYCCLCFFSFTGLWSCVMLYLFVQSRVSCRSDE